MESELNVLDLVVINWKNVFKCCLSWPNWPSNPAQVVLVDIRLSELTKFFSSSFVFSISKAGQFRSNRKVHTSCSNCNQPVFGLKEF
jgi:hypothetical protein